MISRKVRQQTVYTILIALVTLVSLDSVTASAEEKLVAPPYPGAVRLSPLKTRERGIVFAAKDSHEKVKDFYVPKYARMPNANEKSLEAYAKTNLTLIALSYAEVLKIVMKVQGDQTLAEPSLVTLQWLPDEPWREPAPGYFYKLKREAKNYPGHDVELAELRTKYAWLSQAYFIDNKDETILRRCEKERKTKADNFSLWKRCLEEAAESAYLTKIVIQLHPSLWSH